MLSTAEIVKRLQEESELFRGVAEDDLTALMQVMEARNYAAGDVLFRRGDEGDSMYEIIAGAIRIYTEDAQGNELTLVVRRAGEVVGELALLDKQPRSASASAAEPLHVMVLHRDQFMKFLQERPAVGMHMMRTLTGRIRYTTEYLQKVMDWINRLTVGDYHKTLEELTKEAESGGEMQKLIGAFLQMIRQVQDRQSSLEQELDQLKGS